MLKIGGYTLLELLVTVSLMTITILLAIPSWLDWINTAETATQVNQLIAAINFARSEAIKRNTPVSMCQSVDGKRCSGNWNDGYLIFINKDKADQIPAAANRLRFYRHLSSRGMLIWHGKGMFNISPLGYLFVQNSVFSYCPKNKDPRFAREIIISTTGRIRVSKQLMWPCP